MYYKSFRSIIQSNLIEHDRNSSNHIVKFVFSRHSVISSKIPAMGVSMIVHWINVVCDIASISANPLWFSSATFSPSIISLKGYCLSVTHLHNTKPGGRKPNNFRLFP